MNVTYIRGWYIIIPSMLEIIIIALLVIGFFYFGRGSALYYLKKYYLSQIMDDTMKEMKDIINRDKITINRLKEKNKLYIDIIAGVRHLTRRID